MNTLAKKRFPGCTVKFIKALSKFSGYKQILSIADDLYPLKTYKQRKNAAVLLCTRLLQEHFGVSSIADLWRSEASDDKIVKLDDSADCFLQIFCF